MDITLFIDALAPRMGGIGKYCWQLCQRLPEQEGIGTVRYYREGHFARDPGIFLKEHSKLRKPRSWRIVRRWQRRFSRRKLSETLVHGPNYFLPEDAESGIVTIHDLSVLKYPQTHPPQRVAHFEREFEKTIMRSAAFITDSQTVRQEVIDVLGIAPEKVRAIPLGADVAYGPRSSEMVEPFLARVGLRYQGYGLSVSALEPRKRIDALLRGWARLPLPLRQRYPLVLAGVSGWLNTSLAPLIDAGAAAGWLRPLGFVAEAELPLLYAGARSFFYPSMYEGFGLPLVEAMASGVPVVTSARSCMPEICSDAAYYIDPDDDDAVAHAIELSLIDESWRDAARAKGLMRAKMFSWENCAAQTALLYRDVWREVG